MTTMSLLSTTTSTSHQVDKGSKIKNPDALTDSHLPNSTTLSIRRSADHSNNDHVNNRSTSTVSTLLHHRALRDEYASLVRVVSAASATELHRDRQEAVRIRLEHMLTTNSATTTTTTTSTSTRSTRVLHLALQKCNAKLDALTAATRHVDEARARMRVIESKYFHGAKSAAVAPELRALHIRRGTLATLVDHIQCTLYDQVRIHFLLMELATKINHLRTLLLALEKGTSGFGSTSGGGGNGIGSNGRRISGGGNGRRSSSASSTASKDRDRGSDRYDDDYSLVSPLGAVTKRHQTNMSGGGGGGGNQFNHLHHHHHHHHHYQQQQQAYSGRRDRRDEDSVKHTGRTSSNNRTSFSADMIRRSAFNRRVSKSYGLRLHSQDQQSVGSDHSIPKSLSSSTSANMQSTSQRSKTDGRRLSPRRSDVGIIPYVVKRALSYNSSGAAAAAAAEGSEPSWWGVGGANAYPNNSGDVGASGESPGRSTTPQQSSGSGSVRQEGGRFSFNSVLRGGTGRNSGSFSGGTGGNSGGTSSTVWNSVVGGGSGIGTGRPWRRRSARILDDETGSTRKETSESEDVSSFPANPVSLSVGHVDSPHRNGFSEKVNSVHGTSGSDQAVMLDVDSLCTEASSVLSSSRGIEERPRRRGSLSSPGRRPHHKSNQYKCQQYGSGSAIGSLEGWNDANCSNGVASSGGGGGSGDDGIGAGLGVGLIGGGNSSGGSGLRRGGSGSGRGTNGKGVGGKLGFARLRVQGQMKKLWVEINEMYSVVLTHGPHLVEERIVPRSSVDVGLLGSWHTGKGQGASVRISFQSGIVGDAVRKLDGIVTWQHRLVVAIRKDYFEQRKALRHLDNLISKAYLASVMDGDEKG